MHSAFLTAGLLASAAGIPKVLQLMNDPDAAPPGDYKFDPLSMGKGSALAEMQLKEIKNGRLAMMAITGFAVQECLWGSPVVEQTGIFFGRF